MRDLCPRLFPGRIDCAVFFLHIVYVPMQNRSCRISVISVDRARVSLYRTRDMARAAGRKLTTGARSVYRGQETRI